MSYRFCRLAILGRTLTVFAFVLSFEGCGRPHGESMTKDVVTDLSDASGIVLEKEVYYISNSNIVRSKCGKEARPYYNRFFCNGRKQVMPYADFKLKLDNGLSQSIVDLTKEAEHIEKALAAMQVQIRKLQAEIERIENENGGLTSELKRLREEITKLDLWIEECKKEVAAINDRLRTAAAHPDLRLQRDSILKEIARMDSQISQANIRLEQISAELGTVIPQIAALNAEIKKLNARSEAMRADLAAVRVRLTAAKEDFSVYKEVLAYLEDGGVSNQIRSDATWYNETRKFVKRFDKIFDQQG